MHALLRTSVVVVIIGLLTLGIFSCRLTWSPGDYLESLRQGEELHHLQQLVQRHGEGYQHAVEEWIAQRCTFAETMQQLEEIDRELDEAWPRYLARTRESSRMSDEERRYVIFLQYVKGLLHRNPDQLQHALRRFKKDYQQYHTGTPKLDAVRGALPSPCPDAGTVKSIRPTRAEAAVALLPADGRLGRACPGVPSFVPR
jgi:hypothetical protein